MRPFAFDQLPLANSQTLILSPFDNLVIQRQKLKDLFDYDYQIECYVPAKKRKFGYFCLPVFKGRQPVARLDCKADRPQGNLIVRSIHFERGVDRDVIQKAMTPKLKRFASFNGCQDVQWPGAGK